MLELKNISFSAGDGEGEKEILKNVSLKIDESFTVITGPNGGGKSTLAKIIAGIIKPTDGANRSFNNRARKQGYKLCLSAAGAF